MPDFSDSVRHLPFFDPFLRENEQPFPIISTFCKLFTIIKLEICGIFCLQIYCHFYQFMVYCVYKSQTTGKEDLFYGIFDKTADCG